MALPPRWRLLARLVATAAFALLAACQPAAAPPSPSSQPASSLGPPNVTPLVNPPTEPASSSVTATVSTTLGEFTIEVYDRSAPVAAQNFVDLVESRFYDGLVFHRIVPGFVIQGGDPRRAGRPAAGYTIADEPVVGRYGRGVVAMARTPAPNSQSTQFFVVLDDAAEHALEQYRTYVIFGRVTSGMDVVDKIAAGPRGGPQDDEALEPVAIKNVSIRRP